jgi:hypothetical protein
MILRNSNMKKNIFTLGFVATLFFWISTTEASPPKAQCLDGKMPALKVGGFTGPLLCDSVHTSFKFVGSILGEKQSYLLYNYQYQFLPKSGSVLHGGQRLVVLSSKGKYLGQYSLTPPPLLDVIVNGSTVSINVGPDVKGVVEFKNGPPSSTLIDGEPVTFFK